MKGQKMNDYTIAKSKVVKIDFLNMPDEKSLREKVEIAKKRFKRETLIYTGIIAIIAMIAMIAVFAFFLIKQNNTVFRVIEIIPFVFISNFVCFIILFAELNKEKDFEPVGALIIPRILDDLYNLRKCVEDANIIVTKAELNVHYYLDIFNKRKYPKEKYLVYATADQKFSICLTDFEIRGVDLRPGVAIEIDYENMLLDVLKTTKEEMNYKYE